MTECSPLVAANNDFYYRTDAVGMAIPDTQIQIENPDENGIGEILVKGPGVMLDIFETRRRQLAVCGTAGFTREIWGG
ncbi:MAG: hypothetical protein ACLR23_28275 [Clostridia bacterium]